MKKQSALGLKGVVLLLVSQVVTKAVMVMEAEAPTLVQKMCLVMLDPLVLDPVQYMMKA